MGRKVHPIGMRLGINQGWQGRWFAEGSQYRQQLHQDLAIRGLLMGKLSKGGAAANEKVRELRKELPDAIRDAKGKVAVHICRVSDVSKPRGYPPGQVQLKRWDSLKVYPRDLGELDPSGQGA